MASDPTKWTFKNQVHKIAEAGDRKKQEQMLARLMPDDTVVTADAAEDIFGVPAVRLAAFGVLKHAIIDNDFQAQKFVIQMALKGKEAGQSDEINKLISNTMKEVQSMSRSDKVRMLNQVKDNMDRGRYPVKGIDDVEWVELEELE